MATEKQVAEILVDSIYNAGVRVVFGIPGAKVDQIFDTLSDHPEIKLIVARHECNATFMAAIHSRITGIPGVVVCTSGPGASNTATGLMTATTEGDAVVAIAGAVPRILSTKRTHQSMPTLQVLGPVCKYATGIDAEDQAAEQILAAFRNANTSPRGAAVIALPMDVASGKSKIAAFDAAAFEPLLYGPSARADVLKVARMIDEAKLPVLFLGQRAGSPRVVAAVRSLLRKHPMAVIETFQAAGAVPKDLADKVFFGRVGLFRNQTGDRLLAKSDLVISLGFEPTEYDCNSWNPNGDLRIVHVDFTSCDFGAYYRPHTELLGSVTENVKALEESITHVNNPADDPFCQGLSRELISWQADVDSNESSGLVHPLRFIAALQTRVSKDTTVTCDVGTVYIYMMRYFFAYEPRKLLCSNGQQTLGVGMPWAICASLVQDPPCSQKVVSLSGDGGFMFSSQELSTAVQQRCNITHFIWNDSAYNMVEFQEEMKYSRSSGISLGGVDFVKYAESFGAKGFRMDDASQIESVMDQALAHTGVSLVDVRIDYSHAKDLAGHLIQDSVG